MLSKLLTRPTVDRSETALHGTGRMRREHLSRVATALGLEAAAAARHRLLRAEEADGAAPIRHRPQRWCARRPSGSTGLSRLAVGRPKRVV